MKEVFYEMLSAGDLSDDIAGPAIDVSQMYCGAIQCVYAGTDPTGTIAVQGSCDQTSPTTWNNIDTKAITADGSHLFNLTSMGYRWLRLIYTWTSGDGTLVAKYNGKG